MSVSASDFLTALIGTKEPMERVRPFDSEKILQGAGVFDDKQPYALNTGRAIAAATPVFTTPDEARGGGYSPDLGFSPIEAYTRAVKGIGGIVT